jgi:hypothetical protein
MARTVSRRIGILRYVLFVVAIVFNVLLALFPSMIPDKITDRVLLSAALCTAVLALFGLEELKLALSERQDESKDFYDEVREFLLLNGLYRTLNEIEEQNDKIFHDHAAMTLSELETRLMKASQGELILDNADTAHIGMQLADDVQSTLDATVVWPDEPMTKAARSAYLKCLAKAITKRKVKVRRLFVVAEGIENTFEFRERVGKDVNDNVEVRVLYLRHWLGVADVPAPIDFGIWDKRRTWVYKPQDSTGSPSRFAVLYNEKAGVLPYPKLFITNWERGTPYGEPMG